MTAVNDCFGHFMRATGAKCEKCPDIGSCFSEFKRREKLESAGRFVRLMNPGDSMELVQGSSCARGNCD